MVRFSCLDGSFENQLAAAALDEGSNKPIGCNDPSESQIASFALCGANEARGEGRLIRASRFRGDPNARAYLVAVSDKATAIDLITANAAEPGYEIEDLGRVSEDLITAMTLPPGKFVSIDEVRHAAQKKRLHPNRPEKNE